MPVDEQALDVNIENEMQSAYIDYSMSVIVSRALPDVRDGLKPVHRRVLYGMQGLGLLSARLYKKSARVVGEVLGKYHPHGDTSVYDAMVRMAQPWSLRYPLVDGQGNFGSVDGDSPAAMRYTEVRFENICEEMLSYIDKNTVDFRPNFDDSLKEPSVLPARIPNLLVNGGSGIAVGMATNIAPHNLREVTAGIVAYIRNKDITLDELLKHIPAPDFPTGGIIYGYQGVKDAYATGRGRIVLRAKASIEDKQGSGHQIIVTEIPFMVNKAHMIEKTAQLVNEKKIVGISDLRDESDKDGIRIVYELKKDAIPDVVLNNLYKHTALQSSFNVSQVALVHGKPRTLTLKETIVHYVSHRHEVLLRRLRYDLDEYKKKAHILEGYLLVLDELDRVIAMIRNAEDTDKAREALRATFQLSDVQAKAILEMRLQKLTGLEQEKTRQEYQEIQKRIQEVETILASSEMQMQCIEDDLQEVGKKYGDERRSTIERYVEDDFRVEDMIPNDSMMITMSHVGYIKRTNISDYRSQSRGGMGAKGVELKTDDFNEHLFVASNHNYLLFFTSYGKLYWLRVYEIPQGTKITKGRSIQNLIRMEPGDSVRTILNIENIEDEEYLSTHYVVMCTKRGKIKKTKLAEFSRPRKKGIKAMVINEDDALIKAALISPSDEVVLATKKGQAIRFPHKEVRAMGRGAAGVRGIRLDHTDHVIGMVCIQEEGGELMVVSERGYGKRSRLDAYRITRRGGKGIKTLQVTPKVGQLIAIKKVRKEDELLVMKKSGVVIRTAVKPLRVMGRATQGVRLIQLGANDEISAVAIIQQLGEQAPSQEDPPKDAPSKDD